ncbi:ABC transporter ATP-binding protein [Aphanothece stagnina]|uniref:ABC transporter ATP-binding protein n=1 Tax=Aphanothece stagnina TaxID=1004305 RepID=UPI00398F3A47
MIAAEGLSIGHGAQVVGRDVALTVAPGEIVCLLGPNGCGKTTLFRTLLGLIPPLAGRVLLEGRDLRNLKRAEIARHLAYVPQAHVPPFPYQVDEVVLMGRTARMGPLAAPSAQDRAAALAALARLGIGDLAGADYSRLSGGQRQMVMIARALAQEAPVLVMDEPTASLDFGNQARVLARIADLAQAGGHAVVLSTHDPDQAFALQARVVLMHAGGILAEGPPDQVLTGARLSLVYGVPVQVERTASGRAVCAPCL